jgi:threonine dehydrogenase-like Zn-dependent dehydrogenase
MKALVFGGPGQRSWDTADDPGIVDPTDVIVKVDTTTICGTDLHILKGDVPAVTEGRILGHEAVGTVVETGPAVTSLKHGLVSGSTVPTLLKLARDGRIQAERLGTHKFPLSEIEQAYDVFGAADEHDALKVVLTG